MLHKSNLYALFLLLSLVACSKNEVIPEKDTGKAIKTFSIADLADVEIKIDEASHTISFEVEGQVDVTKLIPTIVISEKASVTPASGVTQDFTKPVIYTVKAEDGSSQAYTVTVEKDENEIILVGNFDRHLYAFDAKSGQLKWKFESNGFLGSQNVTAADGLAFYGDNFGELVAVNLTDGSEKWKYQFAGPVHESIPTAMDGVLYVTDGVELTALDISTGTLKWKTSEGKQFSIPPVVISGTVYVGGRKGNINAIDAATGKSKWSFDAGSVIRSSIAISDGMLYCGTEDKGLIAVDALTGKLVWQNTKDRVGYYSSPTISKGVLYLSNGFDKLLVADAKTGSSKWDVGVETIGGSPIVVGEVVFTGNFSGATAVSLPVAETANAVTKWKFRDSATATSFSPSPVYANGVVYVAGNGVHVLDALTGKEVVEVKATSSFQYYNPCIITAKGKVYNTGASGSVQ